MDKDPGLEEIMWSLVIHERESGSFTLAADFSYRMIDFQEDEYATWQWFCFLGIEYIKND